MARFLDNNPGASAHATCDADTTIAPMVPYDRAAWTLGSGNPISDNIELCAFAGFTREQWLSTGNVTSPKGTTVRNPRAILRRGALWAAERCRARGLPIRKLTVEQVRAGQSGICGHIDWNLAHDAGDHWDPGPNFPWDVFINDANGGDDVTEDDINKIVNRVFETDLGGGVTLSEFIRRNSNMGDERNGFWSIDARVLNVTLDEKGTTLAKAARSGQVDLSSLPAEVQAAVASALQNNTVSVDVTVKGQSA